MPVGDAVWGREFPPAEPAAFRGEGPVCGRVRRLSGDSRGAAPPGRGMEDRRLPPAAITDEARFGLSFASGVPGGQRSGRVHAVKPFFRAFDFVSFVPFCGYVLESHEKAQKAQKAEYAKTGTGGEAERCPAPNRFKMR